MRLALAGLAVVQPMSVISPAHAQVCSFNLNTDNLLPEPDTFRFCVEEANTDPNTDTVNSQLAGGSTVTLTATVPVTSSMTIDGEDPYTLLSGTSAVLSLSGGHTLTIAENVTIETTGNDNRGIQILDSGNIVNLEGRIETAGDNAWGIWAIGGNNEISVSGSIETEGVTADGIRALNGNTTIDVSGSIKATGDRAFAIWAPGGNNEINVSGSIETEGNSARGIDTSGGDTTIDVSGSIASTGNSAHAIQTWDGNNEINVSGSISATGPGADAIRFAGPVGGNRLELQPGYSITGGVTGFGNDMLTLGGEGTDSFDSDLIGTQYTGFTEFEKRGGSTWILLGHGGQDWTVFDGTLLVAGTAGFVDLTGGTLGGTGTVGRLNVGAGGAVAPGTSIGTLHVAGDVVFAAGSFFDVEIAADGSGDRLKVGGMATIEGGTVRVSTLNPHQDWASGQSYVILEAQGGRAGEFDALDFPGSIFLEAALLYPANQVVLDVAVITAAPPPPPPDVVEPPTPSIFPRVAITLNQAQVAGGLDRLDRTLGSDSLFVFNQVLFSQTEAAARAAFDLASGELHASVQQALAGSGNLFNETLRRRAGLAGGTELPSFAPLGYAMDGASAGRSPWLMAAEPPAGAAATPRARSTASGRRAMAGAAGSTATAASASASARPTSDGAKSASRRGRSAASTGCSASPRASWSASPAAIRRSTPT